MKTVTLTANEKKYYDGFLLLLEQDVDRTDHLSEGELFILQHNEKPLGVFYYGLQNRGIGYKVSEDLNVKLDRKFFERLFKEALEYRQSLYNAPNTNSFRIYNGEGDGLGGFTIDNYNGHLLIQWYSQGIYMYQNEVVEAVKNVFPYESIYEKFRFNNEILTHRLTDKDVEFPIIIEENGLFYAIHFEDGPMTGLFLDQRDVRNKIMKLPLDGQMLNLFAYSGGFSLAAAIHGMTTTSVDIAKRSLELIDQNFALNGLSPEEHYKYTLDVFDMFRYAARKGLRYQLIVIDPPSFSRSKKRRFSVKEHYHELIEGALPLLERNGYLVLSTNASNYALNPFKEMIRKTLDNSYRNYEITDVMGLPKDFKTTNQYKASKYLKVVFVKVLD